MEFVSRQVITLCAFQLCIPRDGQWLQNLYDNFDGNKKINADMKEYQPVLDHAKVGSSSWLKDI